MILAFVTSNTGKTLEAEKILGFPLEIVPMELDEIQDLDPARIAKRKAEDAFAMLKRPLIVDDVSVILHAWGNFPGPFIKYILKDDNKLFRHFLSHETDRSATVIATIGYHDGEVVHTFSGSVNGNFLPEPYGDDGFGFDPLFIPVGSDKTFAQMNREQKNQMSHRRIALEKLKDYLQTHPLRS